MSHVGSRVVLLFHRHSKLDGISFFSLGANIYNSSFFSCLAFSMKCKGFEDLGRGLIARKDKEIVVIQCKNWTQFKTIYENHTFQFFGTSYKYKQDYPDYKVRAAFFTSTKLSDVARAFSKDLGIELIENLKLERYPCIKCSISDRNKEKIYHLPMDQQYDTVVIEPQNGEFYVMTITGAEKAGFCRAFSWHPQPQG